MISRSEGYDMRLDLMADHLIALPNELFNRIMALIDINHIIARIQSVVRGNLRRARLSFDFMALEDAPRVAHRYWPTGRYRRPLRNS